MSLVITRSFLIFLLILWFFWYFISVNIFPKKYEEIEYNHSYVKVINSKLRNIYWYITWKTTEYSGKTKELYNENIDPTVNKTKNKIADWIDTTKEKIDTVRKSLSWAEDTINKAKNVIEKWKETVWEATEVFNDFEKMSDVIIWSVNTWALR